MVQENKQKINTIKMFPIAQCYCPLGSDWYAIRLEITAVLNDKFPDYIDVLKYINNDISGKSLIIEDVVSKVFSYVDDEINPRSLVVKGIVNDVISHFPVEVTKEK